MISFRFFVLWLSLFLTALVYDLSPAFAQTEIFVSGSGRKYPLALPQLCVQGGDTKAHKEIPDTLARNLSLTGFFDVLNPNIYIESPGKCGGPSSVVYSDWRVIGAEGLVRGTIERDGRQIVAQLYLIDVAQQRVVVGKEYRGDESQAKSMAYRFANEIMLYFTGEPGIFGSRIVFSSQIGRFKELFVMNMDGSDLQQLTRDNGLAISASWAPNGEQIVYTSYRRREPNLFLMSLDDRDTDQLTKGKGLKLGAQFSNNGRQILLSRSVTGDSNLVILNRDGSLNRYLTRGNSIIDVSPTWSPDNRQIAFCSNRSGGPQIYVMNADGSGLRRVSFVSSNYCTSPDWSPDGQRIAFVCRADGGHQLFSSRPDGSDAIQLTSYGNNEDPSWSPDGKYLVFSTTANARGGRNIVLMRADAKHRAFITENPRTKDVDPSWGPVQRRYQLRSRDFRR